MNNHQEDNKELKILKEFYNLLKNNVDNHGDVFDEVLNWQKSYPEVQTFWCSNDYFASSLIVTIPFANNKSVAFIYLDQYSKEIIRINLSKERAIELGKALIARDENK